jgi:hypothetical protein
MTPIGGSFDYYSKKRIRKGNTMAKREMTNGQTTIYKHYT